MELQQELVKKATNKEAYDEIADQIFALREKRQSDLHFVFQETAGKPHWIEIDCKLTQSL